MSNAITEATGETATYNFTHVGIALVKNGVDSLLEASTEGGVRIIPLEDFIDRSRRIDGHSGTVVFRLRDTAGLSASLLRARTYLGQPYDYSFLPENGRMYCSELVWESYRDTTGKRIFQAHPMNFLSADGTLPAYWSKLFEELGEPVPQGIPGTNPNAMSQDQSLKMVYRYF